MSSQDYQRQHGDENHPLRCFICNTTHGAVSLRSFDWHVRPRAKDTWQAYWSKFYATMCVACYNRQDFTTLTRKGWDWWDAADGWI